MNNQILKLRAVGDVRSRLRNVCLRQRAGAKGRPGQRSGVPGLPLAACALLACVVAPTAPAAIVEDFDSPQGSDGHVLFRGDPLYTLPIGISTGGDANGNIHQNAFIFTNFQTLITHDQGGSGYFLYHETLGDGTPSYAGEVWGTLSPMPVTPGLDYIFSFYLTNRGPSAVAQIMPSINAQTVSAGAVSALGHFADGNPAHQWQQFSFTWNSGTATTADLSLFNLTGSGAGNDFAIDTITLTAVPGPSGLALLPVAGLLAMRRPRS